MDRVVVVQAHAIPDRPPLRLSVGDLVEVGRRDGDWPAFVFVQAAQGSGWVPARHLSADTGTAEVLVGYDTTELSTQVGDVLEVLERDDESGWHWCRAADGACGWVPADTLGPWGQDGSHTTPQDSRDDHRVVRQPPIVVRKVFRAPPGALYVAWTDAAVMKRWFRMGPDWTTAHAAADARADGAYAITMQTPSADLLRYAGRYLALTFPERIEMTWPAYGRSDLQTHLRVEFEATKDAHTVLELTHSGLPDEEARAEHITGWMSTLAQLEVALVSGVITDTGGGS